MPRPRSLILLALTTAALLAGALHHAAPPAHADADSVGTASTSLGCVAAGAEVRRSAVTNRKVVALTFDDGPSDFTPAILRILGANGVPATFFEIGENMAGREAIMRQVIAAGDEIGDHTFHHIDLPPLPSARAREELSLTQDRIKRITSFNTCMYRPPHGRRNARTDAIARKLGLIAVMWSVDTKDFTMPGANAIYRSAVNGARPGAIILMHEGGGNRSQTVAALPRIVSTLQARGYQFETVSQLLGLPSVGRR